MPDTLSAILRALSFILLFQAAGTAIFVAVFGYRAPQSLVDVRRSGVWCAGGALIAIVIQVALEAARMAGELSGVFDASLQQMVLTSPSGITFAFRVLGLVIVAVALLRNSPFAEACGLIGATLAVVSFTFTGHTAASPYRWALGALLAMHLLIVAFWFGALWPLHVASRRESAAAAGQLIQAFSTLAIWLVPVILLAGITMASWLLPDLAALNESYGRLLIAKLAGFVLLMLLAALNNRRFGPAIARAEQGAAQAFRRSVAAEYVLICAVLAITAIMTLFFSPSPEHAH